METTFSEISPGDVFQFPGPSSYYLKTFAEPYNAVDMTTGHTYAIRENEIVNPLPNAVLLPHGDDKVGLASN